MKRMFFENIDQIFLNSFIRNLILKFFQNPLLFFYFENNIQIFLICYTTRLFHGIRFLLLKQLFQFLILFLIDLGHIFIQMF